MTLWKNRGGLERDPIKVESFIFNKRKKYCKHSEMALRNSTEDYILFAATLQSEAGYTNNNTHGKETIGVLGF